MSAPIYGLDPESNLTAEQVRDALGQCFFEAHCEDAEFAGDQPEISRVYCLELVKKAFQETGSDFEHPTKSSLKKVLANLGEFAKNFRSQEIVTEHQIKISKLVDSLKD